MNCQKCGKAAGVHLTELIVNKAGQKQVMEIHLCLEHASEAGIITQSPSDAANLQQLFSPQKALKSTAIVPKENEPTDLALSRSGGKTEGPGCAVCGMTWHTFKQHGVLGCAQCYEAFEAKLLPLIKRAQESFGQHAGKVPPGIVSSDPARQVTTARLRRELDQALTQENYEAAAKLRDELRTMGQN